MFGKRAAVALVIALLAFGYVFTMNPSAVQFRLYPGAQVQTSLALVLFLFFLGGFALALFTTAFREAWRSFGFWRHRRADARRDKARALVAEGRGQALVGRTRTARRLLTRAYRKSPETLTALEAARGELEDGRPELAERRLKRLLEDAPGSFEVLSQLGEIYRRRGDFEGQVATMTRWLENEPGHLPTLRALRDLYIGRGNWSEAVRVQERVLGRCENRKERAEERRRLSELRWRHAEAVPGEAGTALLENLLEDDDRFAAAYGSLGERRLAAGDDAAAVRWWTRGYETTGQVGLLLRAEEVQVEHGRTEEALKLYRRLAKKGPAASLLRVRLLLDLERSQEALETLEADRGLARSSRAGRALLGECLFRLRSYDEASKAFRRALFGADGELSLAFSCGQCGRSARRWTAACPHCGACESLELDLGALPPDALPPAKA